MGIQHNSESAPVHNQHRVINSRNQGLQKTASGKVEVNYEALQKTSGKQPILSDDNTKVIAVNGEIYNHLKLRDKYASEYEFKTNSDCEIILALYKKKKYNFLNKLNGIFLKKFQKN